MLARHLQRLGGSVNDPHVGTRTSRQEQALSPATRNPQHVAITTQDHLSRHRQINRLLEPSNRQDTDGTARPMNHLHRCRQSIEQTRLTERVGVTATKLHQPIGPSWFQPLLQRRQQPLCQHRIAKVVAKLHRTEHGWRTLPHKPVRPQPTCPRALPLAEGGEAVL